MTAKGWRIRVSGPARRDMQDALRWTRRNFGPVQAERYRAALAATARRIEAEPGMPVSRARADAGACLRPLHMRDVGQRGRHVFFYRIEPPARIVLVRVLHDAMDPHRHMDDA